MKILYGNNGNHYFDINGNEIHEDDYVLINGKRKKVYLSENGYLGTDATNPIWVQTGKAVECEYGIYPFDECDQPVLDNKGETYEQNYKSS